MTTWTGPYTLYFEPQTKSEEALSFGDIIADLGREVVRRVYSLSEVDQSARVWTWLQDHGISENDANLIDRYHGEALEEGIRVAVRVGYALATCQAGLRNFEEVIRHAIDVAGLAGYVRQVDPLLDFSKQREVRR